MDFLDNIDPKLLAIDINTETPAEAKTPSPPDDNFPFVAADNAESSPELEIPDIFAELPPPHDNYPLEPLLPGWTPSPPVPYFHPPYPELAPPPYLHPQAPPQGPPAFPNPFQPGYYYSSPHFPVNSHPYPSFPMVNQPVHPGFPMAKPPVHPGFPMPALPSKPVKQMAKNTSSSSIVVGPVPKKKQPTATRLAREARRREHLKRKRASGDHPLSPVPIVLPSGSIIWKPFSELAAEMPQVPEFDIEAYINRGVEQRRSKYGNGIARPSNPFLLYRRFYYDYAEVLGKTKKANEISSILGASYRLESQEVKQKFVDYSIRERDHHRKLFPEYTFKPQKKPIRFDVDLEKSEEDEDSEWVP
ncbi:hypothetical protein GGR51DRAFT_252969 [Nemania sp. FL0031]|nr:hypothetical protein GGR51DRAFT_252969 [Nemania sp. FL0031]